MPQFDPTFFASQIFWLLVCFGVFVAAMYMWIFPMFQRIQADRMNKLRDLFDQATRAHEEALRLQRANEYADEEARKEAQSVLEEAMREGNKRYEDYVASIEGKFAQKLDEAREQIQKAQDSAIKELPRLVSSIQEAIFESKAFEWSPQWKSGKEPPLGDETENLSSEHSPIPQKTHKGKAIPREPRSSIRVKGPAGQKAPGSSVKPESGAASTSGKKRTGGGQGVLSQKDLQNFGGIGIQKGKALPRGAYRSSGDSTRSGEAGIAGAEQKKRSTKIPEKKQGKPEAGTSSTRTGSTRSTGGTGSTGSTGGTGGTGGTGKGSTRGGRGGSSGSSPSGSKLK